MRFMKTHCKCVALTLIVTFLALVHVASSPVFAAEKPAPEAAGISKAKAPGLVEEESSGRHYQKKSSILPWVIGGVVVAGVAAVLLLKKKDEKPKEYNLPGQWTLTVNVAGVSWKGSTLTFSGTKTAGTFVDREGDSGTYTVANRHVEFRYNDWDIACSGDFDVNNVNLISGTCTIGLAAGGKVTGSMTMTRAAAASLAGLAPEVNSKAGVAKK